MGLPSSLCLTAILFLALTSDFPIFCLAADYVVEIKVFVDETAFNQWKVKVTGSNRPDSEVEAQIRQFLVPIFLGVNEHYKPLNIETRIVSVTFLRNATQYNLKSTDDEYQMLNKFVNFTNADPAYNADHRLLLTGYDLFEIVRGRISVRTAGIAKVYGMCYSTSNSIVEFHRHAGLAQTISHELGHSFGASHDGGIYADTCPKNGYIMSAFVGGYGAHLFSDCSKFVIKEYLGTWRMACLNNKNTAKLQGNFLGETYDVHKLCQIAFGKRFFFSQNGYLSDSEVCQFFFCWDGANSVHTIGTADGVRCARDKVCWQTRCIKAAPSIGSSCLFEDVPDDRIINGRRNYCNSLDSSDCQLYEQSRQRCCKKCKKLVAQG